MTKKAFLQEVERDKDLTTLVSTQNWVEENKILIESQLEEYGAILISGLPIESTEDLDLYVSAFQYDTLTYEESLSNAVRLNKTD